MEGGFRYNLSSARINSTKEAFASIVSNYNDFHFSVRISTIVDWQSQGELDACVSFGNFRYSRSSRHQQYPIYDGRLDIFEAIECQIPTFEDRLKHLRKSLGHVNILEIHANALEEQVIL